jgi:hypothetical protein
VPAATPLGTGTWPVEGQRLGGMGRPWLHVWQQGVHVAPLCSAMSSMMFTLNRRSVRTSCSQAFSRYALGRCAHHITQIMRFKLKHSMLWQVLALSATYTPELLADLEPLLKRPQRVILCSGSDGDGGGGHPPPPPDESALDGELQPPRLTWDRWLWDRRHVLKNKATPCELSALDEDLLMPFRLSCFSADFGETSTRALHLALAAGPSAGKGADCVDGARGKGEAGEQSTSTRNTADGLNLSAENGGQSNGADGAGVGVVLRGVRQFYQCVEPSSSTVPGAAGAVLTAQAAALIRDAKVSALLRLLGAVAFHQAAVFCNHKPQARPATPCSCAMPLTPWPSALA